ncbi:hydroxymethylglutaryl-CoA reductase, degradative [Spirochaeta lutea]|uniref:hydroxymethylglutaryl-CoA reductase, degradative n=1 Tax=Spirochaeta lutea TaxID=1480694 RepID=UPI0009DCCECB|nr:hydroxymethylglutaryl-CoA reductase, degradative [Spirochaeta lutea]
MKPRPQSMDDPGFRKLTIRQRRAVLAEDQGLDFSQGDLNATQARDEILDLADVMVETAIGIMPVPLGIARGFLIDGRQISIPMATEEPSVIAAASFAAAQIARYGGFTTWGHKPIMTGQVYVVFPPDDHRNKETLAEELNRHEPELAKILQPILEPMTRRGGGYRGMIAAWLPESETLRLHVHLDVRDAMGANLINTCMEALKPRIAAITRGEILMAILTNRADQRLAGARFVLPLHALSRGDFHGMPLAQRILRAWRVADTDPARAVTHNKGIMNGISALALATANDTRGIEAAAHAWAARDGHYRSLSSYRIDHENLVGEIELPLPLATVGGGVGFHPAAQAALKILGNPDAQGLARFAAALGLAQNFAAISALTGEGIQAGHMRLHAGRLAFAVGARGPEIPELQRRIAREGVFNRATAQAILGEMRSESPSASGQPSTSGQTPKSDSAKQSQEDG